MSRPTRIALIAAAAIVFLVISALLARFLSVENAERDAILSLLQSQAAGNERAMLAQLSGCSSDATCRAQVNADAQRLRTPGAVKILAINSATAYTLTGKTGLTRVAWKVPSRLPVVQCARVRRSGNAVTGISVTLLALSAPINPTADC